MTGAGPATSGASMTRGATYAVVVLTAMNLLNYIDRWVPSAVKDLFKADLQLTDFQTSVPLTSFIFIYMLASPIFGSLAETRSRKKLIALGVAVWSIATAAAAFATGFYSLLLARAFVGVGEAAYATIAPALISDYYKPSLRNRVLTFFYVAIPVGSAIGFVLGGFLGAHWGWRVAFVACGLPGLLAAVAALFIDEPERGALDDGPKLVPPPWSEALRALARNKVYVYTVAGYTAVTFATGGIADWFVAFLSRHRGMDLQEASSTIGTVTVVGGIVGTLLGGYFGDKLRGKTKNPYLALSALSMAPAAVLAFVAMQVEGSTLIFLSIGLCQTFLWFYNGPVNALIVNSTAPEMRTRAFALSILCIHLFGDAVSPSIIGAISDATNGNLPLAILVVPLTLALGCVIWAIGWRTIPDVPTRG